MESKSIYLQDNFLDHKVKIIGKDNRTVIDMTLKEIHLWGVIGEDVEGTKSLVPWHMVNMIVDKLPNKKPDDNLTPMKGLEVIK